MTDEQKIILKNANILEEDYENCYITEDNIIFTPLKDIEGNLIKTGKQLYEEDYLKPIATEPVLEEKNRADIDYIMIMQGL